MLANDDMLKSSKNSCGNAQLEAPMEWSLKSFPGASSMDGIQSNTNDAHSKQHRWDRDEISRLTRQIRFDQNGGKSLNQCAVDYAVPRTTAQNWSRNRSRLEQQSGLEPAVVEFFRITPRARVPT